MAVQVHDIVLALVALVFLYEIALALNRAAQRVLNFAAWIANGGLKIALIILVGFYIAQFFEHLDMKEVLYKVNVMLYNYGI